MQVTQCTFLPLINSWWQQSFKIQIQYNKPAKVDMGNKDLKTTKQIKSSSNMFYEEQNAFDLSVIGLKDTQCVSASNTVENMTRLSHLLLKDDILM